MIFLYILLGIVLLPFALILLALLLLCIPQTIHLIYRDQFAMRIRILFFWYNIIDPFRKPKEKSEKQMKKIEERKAKKAEEKARKKTEKKREMDELKAKGEKPEKTGIAKLIEQKGFKGFMSLIGYAMKALTGTFRGIIRAIRINHLYLKIQVGGKDAAEIGKTYGYITAGVYPFLSFLQQNIKIRDSFYNIVPAFPSETINVSASVNITLFPIRIVLSLLHQAFGLLINYLKIKNKGGANHGRKSNGRHGRSYTGENQNAN